MHRPIIAPDLGPAPLVFSLWFAITGERVFEGDRVAEVLAGSAAVEIAAPAAGVLAVITARPGDAVAAGQVLGYLEER